ncbi:hypothetical protein BKA57DRAFT_276341 [Linnemannia elongata]|nr:hypothetical protein BKA57DRAFT_276341 [Linnemannia elongata]
MESMRQQQDGLHQDRLPHGLFMALEELRIDSPVTLDQLVQFLDAFDDIWVAYQHKIITETTASGDEDAWAHILSTSSPDVLDIRKQRALSGLEPRLVDCTETLMSSVRNLTQLMSCADRSCTTNGWRIVLSITGFLAQCDNLVFDMDFYDTPLTAVSPSPSTTTATTPSRSSSPSPLPPRFIIRPGEPGFDKERWPSYGALIPVTIVSFEELCSLWERVLRRLSTSQYSQLEWCMNSESYGDATRVLTALQDRWEQLMVDDTSSGTEDVVVSLPPITNVCKVLRLLERMRDKDLARKDVHTMFQPPPQEMDLGLDLHPPAKLELELDLHLDLDEGLGCHVDEIQDQATIPLPAPPTFDGTHSDDSLYDPNEWFVSPEEVPVPRDVIIVNGPKVQHRMPSSAGELNDQVENLPCPSPPGNLSHDSTPRMMHHSPPVEQSTPIVASLPFGKIAAEDSTTSQLETLRDQQEQGQRQLQQQIERLQQQLESIQLQHDQQYKRLSTLEQKQEPQRQEQTQLSNWFQDWVQQNEQAEKDRHKRMVDMQEQLHWQQQRLTDWGDLYREGVWVEQSDFDRLEIQFERLQKLQRQQQAAQALVSTSSSPKTDPRSLQSLDQKRLQQLVADHHQLETKYRHLKQEFDRQTEKQRRQWERQQQMEQQLAKHQGIIQGHKQQFRQLNSDQKSRTAQYLQRINELEAQLAHLRKSHDSRVASSKSSLAPLQASAEVSPPQGQPAVDPVTLQPSSSKQQVATSTPQSPPSRIRTRRMTRASSSRRDDSTSDAGSVHHRPGPSEVELADKDAAADHSNSTEGNDTPEPEEGNADDNSEVEEESARASDDEKEAKEKSDSLSTITNEGRSVRRSRRHIAGRESEAPVASAFAEPFRHDGNVHLKYRVKRTYKRRAGAVRDLPLRLLRGRRQIKDETKTVAPVDKEEESKKKGKEDKGNRVESKSDGEEKVEDKEQEERRVPKRRPIPNTKLLRSRQHSITNITTRAISTATMSGKRILKKEATVEYRQDETTTTATPKPRLPLLPRITRGSQANNAVNINPNTDTSNISDKKTITSSFNDVDERAKENPRKRSASGAPAAVAKRRLRSLRSARFMEEMTRTRSSGPVKTYNEMLGPNAPRSLRIR